MTNTEHKHSEAWDLASQTAGRYGRLALTRAAGEAAAAQNRGDTHESDLWRSVIATLRTAVANESTATA